MRTIKFRAWDEGNKVMHHNFQFIKSGEDRNDWIVFTSDKCKLSDKPHPLENPYFQLQLKIMQFTGLTDKNGREIYDHDIVLHGYYESKQLPMIILYQAPSWIMKTSLKTKSWYEFIVVPGQNQFEEVIGNFYENPELLEGK